MATQPNSWEQNGSLSHDTRVVSSRLLYLIGQLRAGGSERQLFYLLKTIDRECWRPAVVVWNFCETEKYVSEIRALGVPLYTLADGSSRLQKLTALRRLVARVKAEVVHSYSSFTNFAAWWSSLGTNALAVGAVRSDFKDAIEESGFVLGRLCARWPRVQVFNNLKAIQSVELSRGFFVPKQCLAIRNGLDLEFFRHVPLSINAKARILAVGSLFPGKRWDLLLEAASKLKRAGFDFEVRIVGDGPLRWTLEQRIQALDLGSKVELMGHVDDIPSLLSESTFLAHTSDSEGLPNAVMEAMACGRPVVATDAGDVPSLVESGVTGFVVRRGDEVTLVERMARLIKDRELCRRLGAAGREKAEREFGLSRLVLETLAAYRAAGWKS